MTPPTTAMRLRRAWATRLGRCIGAALLLGTPFAQAEEIVSARYAEPTDRYGHFALGRPHEYAAVLARTDAGRELTSCRPTRSSRTWRRAWCAWRASGLAPRRSCW